MEHKLANSAGHKRDEVTVDREHGPRAILASPSDEHLVHDSVQVDARADDHDALDTSLLPAETDRTGGESFWAVEPRGLLAHSCRISMRGE